MTLAELENSGEWVEWPSFPENETGFDWSLSYEEMDKLYHPDKKKRSRPFNYKTSTSFPKPVEKKRKEEITKAHYVNYMGKDCFCVGFIDRAFSITGVAGVKQYQNAYYHSGEQKYLFMVYGGIVAYPKEKIEKFIKPFFPDTKDLSLSFNANTAKHYDDEHTLFFRNQTPEQFKLAKKHGWKIAKLLTEPVINFHYE